MCTLVRVALTTSMLLATSVGLAEESRPLVIAHRGASGYLPEHTLASKAMAYAMGADYLEQDVVLTKDNQPVVFHDIHLDTVTDVAKVFPGRARRDGRYYVIDFTLPEIRTLRVVERIDLKTNKPVYSKRFPLRRSRFTAPSLGDEIELIQGLNRSTGRKVGVYTEIKSPAWHREQGKDISKIVLQTLANYGYKTRDDLAYVQCFDPDETKRIRRDLKSKLKLVQLIGKNKWNASSSADYRKMRTKVGLRAVAEYADGVGPELSHVITGRDSSGKPKVTSLVRDAHQLGLEVHPYTFRADALPAYAKDFKQLMQVFLTDAKVDGVFTDFPDLAVKYRDGR